MVRDLFDGPRKIMVLGAFPGPNKNLFLVLIKECSWSCSTIELKSKYQENHEHDRTFLFSGLMVHGMLH